MANKGANLCATDSSMLSDVKTKLDINVNVIKTVQALMLIIDFTTPEWVKNLILSLHPIKNMEKHFALPSTDPVKFVMEFEKTEDINYQKVELDEKNVTGRKIKNEFDENSERSTICQSAEVSYNQIIEQKLKPEELACDEEVDAVMQIFMFLLTGVASKIAISSRELEQHNELEQHGKNANSRGAGNSRVHGL